MIQIELSDKEYKLLMSILKDTEDDRNDMSCNDAYKEEEKIFTKKERIKIQKSTCENWDDIDDDERDGSLFNFQYVEYIIDKIKEKKKKIV